MFWLFLIAVIIGVPFGLGLFIGYLWGRSRSGRVASATSGALEPSCRAHPTAKPPYDTAPGQHAPPAPLVHSAITEHRPVEEHRSTPEYRSTNEYRSINVALYIGGLLLVSAALAYVAVMQSPQVTAVAMLLAYALFAVGGYVLAQRVRILKPAGMALFGTSLGLLSVTALPVNEAFLGNGQLTWLLASLLGLTVYAAAAVRLDSRVLGYLAVPLLYSTIFSTTAVLQQGLVWTLVGVIVLGAFSQALLIVLGDRVPAIFVRPFGQLHWIVVPGVVLAGLLAPGSIGGVGYAVLFAAAGIYYVLCAVHPPVFRFKLLYAMAARVMFTAAYLSWLLTLELSFSVLLLLLVLWMAGVYFTVAWLPSGAAVRRRPQHREAAAGMLFAPLLTVLLAQMALIVSSEAGQTLPSIELSCITLIAVVVGVHEIVIRKPGRVRRPMIRGFLALAVFTSLPGVPFLGMVWLSLWFVAEQRLSEPLVRRGIRRGLMIAWAGGLGWSAGAVGADAATGIQLGMLAVFLATSGTLLHWLLDGGGRVMDFEAWIWIGLIPCAALLLSGQPQKWWGAELVAALGLIGLGCMLGLRGLDQIRTRTQTSMAAPVYVGLGVYLGAALLLRTVFAGQVGATMTATGYLAGTAAFSATVLLALGVRDRCPPSAYAERLYLACSAGLVALIASLVPVLVARPGHLPALAWSVPVMHSVLLLLAARWSPHRFRGQLGLAAALVLPLSGLFALHQTQRDLPMLASGAVLVMLLGVLLSEATVLRRWGQQHDGTRKQESWEVVHYVIAGALGTVLALLGLTSQNSLVQIAPVLGAVMLLTAGLMRGRRLGVYWGSVIVVLTVLWSLREVVYGLLITLGVLIIAVAVWRLWTVQRRQSTAEAAERDEDVLAHH